jgi:hypothetical protein
VTQAVSGDEVRGDGGVLNKSGAEGVTTANAGKAAPAIMARPE